MIFRSRCKRFSVLLNDSEDRVLNAHEQAFIEAHRGTCRTCAEMFESNEGLNMLRMCAIEAAPSDGFDDRLLRRIHVDRQKASLLYWSPALVGAAVACLAILAALQMIARPTNLPNFRGPGADARRVDVERGPMIPDLRIDSNDRTLLR